MSRPPIEIDWKKVDQYLQAQCNGTGIAGILGIHPTTLYMKCEEQHKMSFSEYSAQKKGEGKELLRSRQFAEAMKGDKTMLVWLGKQYLEQRDKSQFEHSVNEPPKLEISVNSKEDADNLRKLTGEN